MIGDKSDRTELFSLIEQAVEATLLILEDEPQEVEPATAESITSKKREALALKQVDRKTVFDDEQLKPLASKLSEGWVEKSTDAIHRNRDLWAKSGKAEYWRVLRSGGGSS